MIFFLGFFEIIARLIGTGRRPVGAIQFQLLIHLFLSLLFGADSLGPIGLLFQVLKFAGLSAIEATPFFSKPHSYCYVNHRFCNALV